MSGAIQVAAGTTANTLAIQNLQRSAVLPSWQVTWVACLQGIDKLLRNLRVFTQRCYWGQGVKFFPVRKELDMCSLVKTPQKAKEEVIEDFFLSFRGILPPPISTRSVVNLVAINVFIVIVRYTVDKDTAANTQQWQHDQPPHKFLAHWQDYTHWEPTG